MKPKQADILRHASALFNREGYQSPSIERIAEHAGISKMTFYRYYATLALYRRWVADGKVVSLERLTEIAVRLVSRGALEQEK